MATERHEQGLLVNWTVNTSTDSISVIEGQRGANGIGAATVELFRQHGAKVASVDIRESTLASDPDRIDIKCNVTSEAEVVTALDQVLKKWQTVDVLCNVAGVADNYDGVDTLEEQTLDRVMAINFKGPFYVTRAVVRHFLSKPESSTRGSIVNVCSRAAVSGGAAGLAYTASKHALLGLTRNTAFVYEKQGIRCNAVLPGGVQTNIGEHSEMKLDEEKLKRHQLPLAFAYNIAQPADIANAIVFLAGATSTNGAELAVDHAWSSA